MVKVAPHMRSQAERVGAVLRQARPPRTLIQLAEQSGFSKSTLHRWESGKDELPSPEQAARLDEILGTKGALHEACMRAITRAALGFPRGVGFMVFPPPYTGEVYMLLQAPPDTTYDTLGVSLELSEEWGYRRELTQLDHIGQAFLAAKPGPTDYVVLVRTSEKVIMSGGMGFPELEDSSRIHIVRKKDWKPLGDPRRP